MSETLPPLPKRELRLPDGRRLVYYDLPEAGAPGSGPPAPPAPPPAPRER